MSEAALDMEVRQYLERLAEAGAVAFEPIAADLARRMRERATDLDLPGEDWFWDALGRSLAANLPGFFAHLGGDREPPAELPPQTVDLARAAARGGVALADLLQVMRAAQGPFLARWQELFDDLGVDGATRARLLDATMGFTIRYQDWITSAIAVVHRAEAERRDDRLALVTSVLAGHEVSGPRLGYDLSVEHLAAVATGPDGRAALAVIAGSLGRHLLCVAPDDRTAWGWLGGRPPLDERELRRLGSVAPPAGTVVALGEPHAGAEGFRASHREAALAARVAPPRAPVTRYRDIALEAALLRDPEAARALVRRELAPLGEGERGDRLRATLRAVFATGNGASAAAALGVSPRTVTSRIAEIEDRLGCALHARRTELDVALRLERALARE